MNSHDDLKYVEKFEDDGFVYELNVEVSNQNSAHLFTCSQGNGFQCRWEIVRKNQIYHNTVAVTDDQCELIIFDSVESAIKGAKEFLSIQA